VKNRPLVGAADENQGSERIGGVGFPLVLQFNLRDQRADSAFTLPTRDRTFVFS
jgi:hypothetical protein